MTTATQQLKEINEARLRLINIARAPQNFTAFKTFCYLETPKGIQLMEPWHHLAVLDEPLVGGKNIVNLKTRQIGISWDLAAFALWKAMFQSVQPVMEFSQGELESSELLRKSKLIYEHLPAELQIPLAKKFSVTEAAFSGAGRIISMPSTEKAGRSFSSSLVIFDENAFHAYARENFAAAEPQAQQVVLVSTAFGDNFFARQFWAAYHGESDYTAVFFPWWSHPDRQGADGTPDYDWYAKKKRAYPGFEDDFRREYPATPQEAFLGKEGLVYPMYDEKIHVLGADPFPWAASKTNVAGVDFGGGDPTAIITLGVSSSGRIHQFHEFYEKGPIPVEQIGSWLHGHGPFAQVLCDPSEPVAIASLRAAGLPAVPADNRRAALGLTASLLKQGRLSIAERCINSRKEFIGYRWRVRTDPNVKDRYATSTPVDHHADAMDARRYALVYLMRREFGAGQAVGTVSGRPLARSAV